MINYSVKSFYFSISSENNGASRKLTHEDCQKICIYLLKETEALRKRKNPNSSITRLMTVLM